MCAHAHKAVPVHHLKYTVFKQKFVIIQMWKIMIAHCCRHSALHKKAFTGKWTKKHEIDASAGLVGFTHT